MKTYNNIILSIIVALLLLCCNNSLRKKESFLLSFNEDSSFVSDNLFPRDSIIIEYYQKDSMLFLKYSNGDYKENLFFLHNGNLVERHYRGNDFGEILGIDSIITFSTKDTSFFYKSALEFIPIVQAYSFADCRYVIKKQEEEYVTVKQSTIDTTYKEIFFYDKDFNIHKYINTYKDNYCVYIRKE